MKQLYEYTENEFNSLNDDDKKSFDDGKQGARYYNTNFWMYYISNIVNNGTKINVLPQNVIDELIDKQSKTNDGTFLSWLNFVVERQNYPNIELKNQIQNAYKKATKKD